MRITVELELQESELQFAPQVLQTLQVVSDHVVTRVVTDKPALAQLIRESVTKGNEAGAVNELARRVATAALAADCIDVFCGILFSVERVERMEPAVPYIALISRLVEPQRSRLRDEVVQRAVAFLSQNRRLDHSRETLLPYAEAVAALVKVELLGIKNVVSTLIQLIRYDSTRCAGITCLGKLVEVAHDLVVERCDGQLLEQLRVTLGSAQQDDTFVYDVEYIMEPFGWNQGQQNQRFVNVTHVRGAAHHMSPILSLAYSSSSIGAREIVVTSSADGTIATWDPAGNLVENCVLARHYASSLDLTRAGKALIVGSVGRSPSTAPAVVFYVEEAGRWVEKGAVEPEGARVVTAVKSLRNAHSLLFCCGVSGMSNSVCYYDAMRQVALREFLDHSDIVTALYTHPERDLVFSGSRDCTVCMYDLRSQAAGSQYAHHYSTVTCIDGFGDYIVTGGLDKRIMVHDLRMLHPQNIVRDLDSAVLSVSISPQLLCAAATLTGVQLVSLTANGLPMCKADCMLSVPRYNGISWNTTGSMLYAGGDTCTLDLLASN
jgi:hypothetical protein